MSRFARIFVLGATAAVLASPAVARAQAVPPPEATVAFQRPPDAPVSVFRRVGVTGIELELRVGIQFGGGDSPVHAPTLWSGQNGTAAARGAILDPAGAAALGQSFTAYGIDPFAFSGTLGYRFHPNFSAGAFFSYAQYAASNGADAGDAPDFTSALQRQQFTVGAYGRYYFTFHSRLQPWVELGVGYNGDIATYTRPVGQASSGQPETGNYTLRQNGVVVPLMVGLDVRPAPILSLGPTLGYWRVFPTGGCVEVVLDNLSPVPATNTCSSPPVTNDGYGVIFGGLYAKVTLDPFTR